MINEKALIVLGAGGHAKVVQRVAFEVKIRDSILFFDDHFQNKQSKSGLCVEGPIRQAFLPQYQNASFFVAFGDNLLRMRHFQSLTADGRHVDRLCSAAAYLSPTAIIGGGSIVMPLAVLSEDVRVGSNVIVNTGALVEHDCFVGDHSHLAPGSILTGGSRIGSLTLIGAGAVVCPGVTVGDQVMLGAGAVATKDILEPGRYFGVPARKFG